MPIEPGTTNDRANLASVLTHVAIAHALDSPGAIDNEGKSKNMSEKISEQVYKVVEVIGSSVESWEKAAAVAVKNAAGSLKDLRVARVLEQDVRIGEKGEVVYRTRLDLSFRLHDKSEVSK